MKVSQSIFLLRFIRIAKSLHERPVKVIIQLMCTGGVYFLISVLQSLGSARWKSEARKMPLLGCRVASEQHVEQVGI